MEDKVVGIEISLIFEGDEGMPEHEGYYDTPDEAIEAIERIRKNYNFI